MDPLPIETDPEMSEPELAVSIIIEPLLPATLEPLRIEIAPPLPELEEPPMTDTFAASLEL